MLIFKWKDTECFVRTETNSFGTILFVKENIPRKIINKHQFPFSIETIFFQFSVYKRTASSLEVQGPFQSNEFFANESKLAMAKPSNTYESSLETDDFNMTPQNKRMIYVSNIFCLEHLMNKAACFKPAISSCSDLILTNKKSLFMRSETFESGFFVFLKATTAIIWNIITKSNPRLFDQNKFNEALKCM